MEKMFTLKQKNIYFVYNILHKSVKTPPPPPNLYVINYHKTH